MPIEGVLPVIQTPFCSDGALDEQSLGREARYICEAGADGMVFPGFVSEWWKLSEAEILRSAEILREETRSRAQLILNVTAQGTRLAVEQARKFQQIGCDAIMCLPPFVVEPSPAAALAHLAAILDAVPLPHILQYSSSLTGLRLDPPQIAELRRRYPHLSAIKVDCIPPAPVVARMRQAEGLDGMTYIIGYAGLQLPDSLARGANGLMGGAGHVEVDIQAFRALRRDAVAGRDVFNRLLPLLNFEMQTVGMAIAVHKHLLHRRGIIQCPLIRQPGAGLEELDVAELRAVATASIQL